MPGIGPAPSGREIAADFSRLSPETREAGNLRGIEPAGRRQRRRGLPFQVPQGHRRRNAFDVSLLPQQQLVLELLRMSGEIAVLESAEGTILWRTLQECRNKLWIIQEEVSPGVFSVSLTAAGRRQLESAG